MSVSPDILGQIPVEIVDIKLTDSILRFPNPSLGKPKYFTQNIALHHQGQLENNILIGSISVQIFHENNENELLGLISVSVVFKVPELDSFIEKDDDQPKIKESILNYINIIVSSTARGIMYQNFKGSILERVILPLFSTKDAQSFSEGWNNESEEE